MPPPREPQRRTDEQRRKHLDASVVPVERALLARAAELSDDSDAVADTNVTDSAVKLFLSTEFRALADELHYWG